MSKAPVGVPTFAGFDLAGTEAPTAGSLAVFGVPADSSPPRRPGCAAGPLAIREASLTQLQVYLQSPSRTVVDLDSGQARRLRESTGHLDLGDIECHGHLTRSDIETITQLSADIVSANACPILLGGDSRAVEGLVRGVATVHRDAALLVFSNALLLPGMQQCAPFPLGSLIGSRPRLASSPLLCVGTHGLQAGTAWNKLNEVRGAMVTAEAVHENFQAVVDTIRVFLAAHDSIICCLDLEVIDSGHAAGTPDTNVGGLTPEQLIALVASIDIAKAMVGVAVTNTAPRLDQRGLSEAAAAQCLLSLLGSRMFDEVNR